MSLPTLRATLLFMLILTLLFGAILLWAMGSKATLIIEPDPSGTGAIFADAHVILTATVSMQALPYPYYSDPTASSFYYQSNGLLSWLESVQQLRPGLAWRDLSLSPTQTRASLVGVGATVGNSISAALVFSATDGNTYLIMVSPQDRQLAWLRWDAGQPTLLATAVYHADFAAALLSLFAEVALIYFYALTVLLLLILLALLLRFAMSLLGRGEASQ